MMCPHERAAFDALYREYTPYVTRLARRLSRDDRDTAEDLAQEAWLALLRTPEQRWTEPCYVRTVAFRAMWRWVAREQAPRRAVLPECSRRPRRRAPGRARGNALRLRRNVPRQRIEPCERPVCRAA